MVRIAPCDSKQLDPIDDKHDSATTVMLDVMQAEDISRHIMD